MSGVFDPTHTEGEETMTESMSLIQFFVINFYSSLMNNRMLSPNFSDMYFICKSLVLSEPEPDKKYLEKLEYIYNNTNEEVNAPLAVIEMLVFKNIQHGISKEIDIYGKEFSLNKLYAMLDAVNDQCLEIVVAIAKKYSIDFPVGVMNGVLKFGA
jgi:hypothetical protein